MVESAKLPWWMKPANRLIIALQRRGIVIGTMRLLSVPGRKSGRLRTTPVSPLVVEGRRYIVGGFPKADWVENARTSGWGVLVCGREEERVGLVELPPGERSSVLRELPSEVPHGVSFFVRAGIVESPTPESFAKAAPKCVVFEVVPAEGGRS